MITIHNPKTIHHSPKIMEQITLLMVDDEPIIRKAVKYELNERHECVECLVDDNGNTENREIVMTECYASGPQLMAALSSVESLPDYILVDMEFQGEPTGGLLVIEKVHKLYPSIRLIVFSGRFDNPLATTEGRERRIVEIGKVVFEALGRGASAFVSKNASGGFSIENIVRAVACLERGEEYYFNYPVMLTLKEAAEQYFKTSASMSEQVSITDTERQILLFEAAGCTAQEIAFNIEGKETEKSVQEKQKELSRKLDILNKSGSRIAKAVQLRLIDLNEVKFLKR